MAWFSRFTRFGDAHLVYGQEANMSCGIASVMMCVFKINKLKPGKDAVTVETDITKRYTSALGSAYNPEVSGTYPTLLAQLLNRFTSGNWAWHQTAPNDVGKVLTDQVGLSGPVGPIVDVEPAILGVDWDQGGAHWVVVDTIRDVPGRDMRRYATHGTRMCTCSRSVRATLSCTTQRAVVSRLVSARARGRQSHIKAMRRRDRSKTGV